VQCPRCQAENREGRRFCAKCGASLALACAACSFANEPGEDFCGGCGQPLGSSPNTPPAPAPETRFASPQIYTPQHLAERIISSRGALEGERKQVTVLFADLKGSMELLADRDPEEARRILDPVLERMMDAVHRYEGTVNQVLGDGIMALFGAPLAHEDHAQRACYAALRMQEAVKQYADEVWRSQNVRIQIRVGLNSGEVVVRSIGSDLRMDYTAVGQTTHLAARMEQLATPGSVLLASDSLQLAEGYVQVRSLGPVQVKGLGDPIEVYELIGAGMVRSRLQAAAARGLTKFVGRAAELETLRRTLEQAGSGHGQIVALVGEPGVGKSRLVWEFGHSHRTQGWLVLESGSVSYGKATSYLPVIDLLKSYCGIEDRDDTRRIRQKVLGKVLELDPALQAVLPPLLSLLEVTVEDPQWQALDPPQRRQRTLDAVKRLILRESQEQPLLLVFEDLHWIDAETQALLDSLVESLPTARILLLVNYRPEYEHSWHRKTYYQQLRLDPLPLESAEELLAALLGDAAALQPLKRVLIERTEGNPFFVEESVRTLVEGGVLAGERGGYALAKPFESTQVPATVQAVLGARIDRLTPEDKRLLQAAAVIGKDVPYVLLQAIAELAEDTLRQGIARLHAAEFLYETSLFPELEYTFKHALTHEVAYGSLLHERRRALHARIMDAAEQLYPGRQAEQVERLAHHALWGEVWERAVGYLHQAGAKTAARSAYREAAAYFRQAIEALGHLPTTPDTTAQAIAVRLDLGVALMAFRDSSREAEEVYSAARELCLETGDTAQLFRALWGLWMMEGRGDRHHSGRVRAQELLVLARQEQDPALLLEAHHVLCATALPLGEFTAGITHAEQGIAIYDPRQHRGHAALYGGHDPGVCCRGHLAATLWLVGYPEQALRRGRDALALAEELGHPFSLIHALIWAARVEYYRGEWNAAHDRAEAAIALAADQRLDLLQIPASVLRGRVLIEQGQEAEGLVQIEQGLAYWARGGPLDGSLAQALVAAAFQQLGRISEGLDVITRAHARAEQLGTLYYAAELLRLRGELLLSQARPATEEAEACFTEALATARRQEAKSLELRAAMSLSRLWERQGKQAEARRLLADVYGWFSEGFDTRDLREARALLDGLSA
jgi:class 3 adenylate cyclase/predicted ATPase